MLIQYKWQQYLCSITTSQMDMNISITKEVAGLVEVSKHVGWGVLNHHVLRSCRVLWRKESNGVARSRGNVLRTTSSIGAIWMKVEVGFKPFPSRCVASMGLLVQNGQMLWGLALVSGVRAASTLVAKLRFVKLGLCGAFPTPVGKTESMTYNLMLILPH